MNVLHPTLSQAAFMNGFLGAPIITEGSTLTAEPGASEIRISQVTDRVAQYQAIVLVTDRASASKGVYEIRSDPLWMTFFSFPGFEESVFLLGDSYATRFVHVHGDGVRALALAVFPNFEAADLEAGSEAHRTTRRALFRRETIDEIKMLFEGARFLGHAPREAYQSGREHARRLARYLCLGEI